MTIVTYEVFPTHRYFMRKTKEEIIVMMELMKGEKFPLEEKCSLRQKFKDELASMAMRIVRTLQE